MERGRRLGPAGSATLLAAILLALWAPTGGHAAVVADGPSQATVGAALRVPAMTGPRAKFAISRILKQSYKRVWIFGDKKRIRSCKKLTRVRMSCKVSWIYKNNFLHGRAAAYYKQNGEVWVKYRIKADRI